MYLRKQITVMKLSEVIKKKKRQVEAKQRAVGVVSPVHFGCRAIKPVCFLPTWVSWGSCDSTGPCGVRSCVMCCGHGFRAHPARSRLRVLPVFFMLALLGTQGEQQGRSCSVQTMQLSFSPFALFMVALVDRGIFLLELFISFVYNLVFSLSWF